MNYKFAPEEQDFVIEEYTNVKCYKHIHRGIEVVFVNEGTVHMTIGEKEYEIAAGCAVYAEPYEVHGFSSSDDSICTIMEFSPECLPCFRDMITSQTAMQRTVRLRAETLAYLMSRLSEGIDNMKDPVHSQTLLSLFMCEFRDLCEFTARENTQSEIFIKALDFICQNLKQDISLSAAAAQVGVRPETLSRMFSAHSKKTFAEYVQYLRVHRAAQYLNRGCTCMEAALNAGFGSICSFNRVFRNVMNMTPTEYRRREM